MIVDIRLDDGDCNVGLVSARTDQRNRAFETYTKFCFHGAKQSFWKHGLRVRVQLLPRMPLSENRFIALLCSENPDYLRAVKIVSETSVMI
jgi:hypothetical protein